MTKQAVCVCAVLVGWSVFSAEIGVSQFVGESFAGGTCTGGVAVEGANAVLSGTHRIYWVDRIPEGTNSIVRMTLSADDLEKANAQLCFGEVRVGLCSEKGNLYAERCLILWDVAGGVSRLSLSEEAKKGGRFEVLGVRRNGRFTLDVAGVRVFSVNDFRPGIGAVGICPGQGRIRVHRLNLEANSFTPAVEMIRANAARKAFASKFPVLDLSTDKSNDIIVAAGTPSLYQGHPTMVTTGDGRIITVWCIQHGGPAGQGAESKDGGKTWTRIDDRFPPGFRMHADCPSIYRLIGPDRKARLWVWSQSKIRNGYRERNHYARDFPQTCMPSIMSEDEGYTWREMPPLGPRMRCKMAFTTVIRLKDGSYLAGFHRGPDGLRSPLVTLATQTRDGGFTWSDPKVICKKSWCDPCEPYFFRSPDGNEIGCLLRDNLLVGNSLMTFSRDEGKTWSEPEDTPWALTGDRHQVNRLGDGRYLVSFRDRAIDSPTYGHYLSWVGSYEALRGGNAEGAFRMKLLHSYAGFDCGNSGVTVLSDGRVLAVTYVKYAPGRNLHSVVAKIYEVPPAFPEKE